MLIGAGGQVVARIAREAGEDLSHVFLRDVKLKLSAKVRTWGDESTAFFWIKLIFFFYTCGIFMSKRWEIHDVFRGRLFAYFCFPNLAVVFMVVRKQHLEMMFNNIFNKLSYCIYSFTRLFQWHIWIIISFLNTSLLWKKADLSLAFRAAQSYSVRCPWCSSRLTSLQPGLLPFNNLFLFPWLPPPPDPPFHVQGPSKTTSAPPPHPGLNSLGNGWPNGALTCC